MLAQLLSIVLVNTYSWFGGQGYCAFDFALLESETEYRNVEIVLRPQFDPQDTASGNTELGDETIALDVIGGDAVNSQQSAKIETDCSVTGFQVVTASANVDGRAVDLLEKGAITLDTYKALPLTLGE